MSYLKHSLRRVLALGAAATLALFTLWACHLDAEEATYMNVKADSSWTAFDSIKVILQDKDGNPLDTLFRGKLASPDDLAKLPIKDYDGREVRIVIIGIDDGVVVKTDTRQYDGKTQLPVKPNVVIIIPIDHPEDTAALDIKPDTLRLYVGGVPAALVPEGTHWAGKSLTWSSGDAAIATVTGGSVKPVSAGKTWIRVAAGAKGKDSTAVTVVLDVPVLDAGPDTAVPIGANLAFTVKVKQEYGGVAAFKWSLDGDSAWDDSAAGLPAEKTAFTTPAKAFPSAGTLVLRFLVRDSEGNEAIVKRTLTVTSQIPKITALAKDWDITAGDSVAFVAKAEVSGGSLKKAVWTYGDGSAEETAALSGLAADISGGHLFAKEGTFKVTLTVSDDAGTPVSASVTVKVAAKKVPKPPVANAGKDTSLPAGENVTLQGTAADPDGSIAKLEWKVGSAEFASANGGKVTFTLNSPGTSVCILRATDNEGLTGEDTVAVTFTKAANKPPLAFAGKDTSVQVGTAVKLRGTGTDPDGTVIKLEWSIAGSAFAAGSDTSFTPNAVGSVRCLLRAIDNEGLAGLDTVDVTVTKLPPPVISLFTPGDTTISINDSVSFSLKVAGSVPLKSYSWDFNGDGTADEMGALVGANATLKTGKRFGPAGTYVVTFKVTDEAGEAQTRQATLKVELDPPTAEAGLDTTVAAGSRVNLHGKASDKLGTLTTWSWQIGVGTGSFTLASTATGFDAPVVGGVALPCIVKATDDDGQVSTDTLIVTVLKSTNANLTALASVSGLTLKPAFSPTVYAYADTVTDAVVNTAFTATLGSTAATATFNGAVFTGGSTASQALKLGSNLFTFAVTAQDGVTKNSYLVTVVRQDKTAPTAPTVSGTTPATSATPTWTWTPGTGGVGAYRVKLDNADLTTGATLVATTSFTPPAALTDGVHTLYVQERDSSMNWSVSGSAAIAVFMGPVSWYKFDGTLADAGPNASTGVGAGGLAYTTDRTGSAGKAVQFNDLNAMITTGTAPYGVGNNLTVSAWVKVTATTALQYFLTTPSVGIGMTSRGPAVSFVISTPSTNNAGSDVTTAVWTQITGTYDGTNIKCYKNGVLQETTSHPGTNSGNGNLSNMVIGMFNGNYWDGALDDLRFFNRVLTQAEITALYNGGQ